ncbi:MAG: hypothetical protein ACRCW1_07925 [Anaerotignaceae bacterium]
MTKIIFQAGLVFMAMIFGCETVYSSDYTVTINYYEYGNENTFKDSVVIDDFLFSGEYWVESIKATDIEGYYIYYIDGDELKGVLDENKNINVYFKKM